MSEAARSWLKSYPAGVRWDATLPLHPLHEFLDRSAVDFADRSCLDFLGRKCTYREVGDLVTRAAAGLQAQGVVKGTRVGLFLPNCPYYVILFYAVLKA